MADCYTCIQESALPTAPAAEKVYVGEHWRVALALGSALPGWVVVVPRRHTTRVADLTAGEAADLGPLLVAVSRAIETVTRSPKTYVMQFAEAEGFSHVHFHVTPRSPDVEHRGPKVFAYLNQHETMTSDEKDQLAEDLGVAITVSLHRG